MEGVHGNCNSLGGPMAFDSPRSAPSNAHPVPGEGGGVGAHRLQSIRAPLDGDGAAAAAVPKQGGQMPEPGQQLPPIALHRVEADQQLLPQLGCIANPHHICSSTQSLSNPWLDCNKPVYQTSA